MEILEDSSLAGCCIGLLFSLLSVLTVFCSREKRVLAWVKLQLYLSVVFFDLTLVAGFHTKASETGCFVRTILLHYVIIVCALWTLIDMKVLRDWARDPGHESHSCMICFSVIIWGLPMLVVALGVCLGIFVKEGRRFSSMYSCWNNESLMWTTLSAFCIITILTLVTIVQCCSLAWTKDVMVNIEDFRHCLKMNAALFLLWLVTSATLLTTILQPCVYSHAAFGMASSVQSLALFFFNAVASLELVMYFDTRDSENVTELVSHQSHAEQIVLCDLTLKGQPLSEIREEEGSEGQSSDISNNDDSSTSGRDSMKSHWSSVRTSPGEVPPVTEQQTGYSPRGFFMTGNNVNNASFGEANEAYKVDVNEVQEITEEENLEVEENQSKSVDLAVKYATFVTDTDVSEISLSDANISNVSVLPASGTNITDVSDNNTVDDSELQVTDTYAADVTVLPVSNANFADVKDNNIGDVSDNKIADVLDTNIAEASIVSDLSLATDMANGIVAPANFLRSRTESAASTPVGAYNKMGMNELEMLFNKPDLMLKRRDPTTNQHELQTNMNYKPT